MKDVRITIFPNIGETTNPNTLSLYDAFERIKGNKGGTKPKIEAIRSAPTKEERNNQKKQLPCVLFSGEFRETEIINEQTGEITVSARHDKSLAKHSGVVVLDWDDIEPQELRPKLKEDPYILACWVSPSGNGLKALVKITDTEKHHAHYRSILSVFNKKYKKFGELDKSNINPSRVCYESYDPLLYVNWDSWIYGGILEEKKAEPTLSGLEGIIYNYDYSKIMPSVKMIRNSLIGERNITFVKASKLAGGYIKSGFLPKELTMHILKREYQKINPEEPDKDVDRALNNGIEYGMTMPIYEFDTFEEESLNEIGDAILDFVIDYSKHTKELWDIRNGTTTPTFSTGWPRLDNNFIWKKSDFIVNLGHSNVGKTWLAFYLMAATSVRYGWKHIIFSAENKKYTQIRDLMQMVAGKKTSKEHMTDREFSFYNQFVREHFEFIDNSKIYSYIEILAMAEKALKRKHYDYLLIDPYNSLSRKNLRQYGSTHDYDNEAASKMLSWANGGDTGIFLNIHTHTGARREKDAQGYSKRPYKDAAEGGGKWDSKSDTFLVSHRVVNHDDVQERFITDFSVEKVRDTETGGRPHPMSDPFRIKLMYGSYFIDLETGERAFQPLKMGLTEI